MYSMVGHVDFNSDTQLCLEWQYFDEIKFAWKWFHDAGLVRTYILHWTLEESFHSQYL
jgi:hypothetical protein